MKLLKKLALATPSDTIPHDHFTASASTNTFLTCCLRNLAKLSRTWIRGLNHSDQEVTNIRPDSDKKIRIIDWAPLVKASLSNRISRNSSETYHQNGTNPLLAGRCVLCVGGRIKLYPEYNQLIKNCGGCFRVFHGGSHDNLEDLPQLLKQADMIICPVDCVNHEAFLTVKYYCKHSGKPCVLLDRSEINTFKTGIRMLAAMIAKEICINHCES